MAMFIQVTVDNALVEKTEGAAEKLVEVCPVKIYAPGSKKGTVNVVEENVDECTLCELCLKIAPNLAQVKKLYEE